MVRGGGGGGGGGSAYNSYLTSSEAVIMYGVH